MSKKYSEEVARVLGNGDVKKGTEALKSGDAKKEIKIVDVKKPKVSASDAAKGIVKNVKSQGNPQTR